MTAARISMRIVGIRVLARDIFGIERPDTRMIPAPAMAMHDPSCHFDDSFEFVIVIITPSLLRNKSLMRHQMTLQLLHEEYRLA